MPDNNVLEKTSDQRFGSKESLKTNEILVLTMDNHLTTVFNKIAANLSGKHSKLKLKTFVASDWSNDEKVLEDCKKSIASSKIIFVSMLFMEDHFKPILRNLKERRESCDAMVCIMSAPEVSSLTRMGRLDMSKPASGALAFLKKLRGKESNGSGPRKPPGESQMRILRKLPKFLKFIPGTAQDLRVYFLSLQYWLSGSEENMLSLILMLTDKYMVNLSMSSLPDFSYSAPKEYPEIGVYHPRIKGRIAGSAQELPKVVSKKAKKGTVGLIVLRSYLLAGNTGHYDGIIAALESHGIEVIPCFSMGLDARPAIEKFFFSNGKAKIDTLLSLTGFSLVGGPAYNDSEAAKVILGALNVPYISAHPLEFQSLDAWEDSATGLLPVENTIMVAIPELDGAVSPMVYGGRRELKSSAENNNISKLDASSNSSLEMTFCSERVSKLAGKIEKIINLRKKSLAEKKVGFVIFNFPPNCANVGTAAHLDVFESLFNTLSLMKQEGYSFDLPENAGSLKSMILKGNSEIYGSDANVAGRTSIDDYVSKASWLNEVEEVWGVAPGKQDTDGQNLFIHGLDLGNIFIGVQPAFGFEGDPMRLLLEKGHAPTHAFCNFYRFLREDFKADALFHFGTHGALEFMPGKQVGLSGKCWPDRLINDLPNFYLYASNNPSEGTLAKRRIGATLVSYMTPPICEAGLYKGLEELKSLLDSFLNGVQFDTEKNETNKSHSDLVVSIFEKANELSLLKEDEDSSMMTLAEKYNLIGVLRIRLLEYEETLIPHGLHIVGGKKNEGVVEDLLMAICKNWMQSNLAFIEEKPEKEKCFKELVGAIIMSVDKKVISENICSWLESQGKKEELKKESLLVSLQELIKTLDKTKTLVNEDSELNGIISSLNGEFIQPAVGGDILKNPDVLPTGRNIHGFDPFRIPSKFAVQEGSRQANQILEKAKLEKGDFPQTVAVVLWGTDNLKTEGCPIAQVLHLMGAKPRFDSYGRLSGAELISLKDLGRPRIDVMVTLSGIFRDLLPLQIKTIAEAAFLAASADEPLSKNFVRAHVLEDCKKHNCDIETASMRVFGNCEGSYGANVNHLIENSCWDSEDELADVYSRRKGFAYGLDGKPKRNDAVMENVLQRIDLAYQNLDSVEVGITTIDTYFDTLGGLSKAVKKAKQKAGKIEKESNEEVPIYIADHTQGKGTIRGLSEQVALETRTRSLNPKWYEGMLSHGCEGVRQIEAQLTHTLGWSATTGQVQPWVYQQMTETFILDAEMRDRIAELNPQACSRVVNRLLEASKRKYWNPSETVLSSLEEVSQDLEDKLEGITEGVLT